MTSSSIKDQYLCSYSLKLTFTSPVPYKQRMSTRGNQKLFVGFMSVGLLGPAVALICGYPDAVVQGLGSKSREVWDKTPESKFGLYMYTVSDIALGLLCAAATFGERDTGVSEKLALAATCVHQVSYLAAAIPAFGFKKLHISSMVTAAIAGMMALSPE